MIYTDNTQEFGKSCEDLQWNHCASTPHRSESNVNAERAVRMVKEGTSAILLQSALDELPGCAGQASDAVSAYTQVKMEDASAPFKNLPSMNVLTFGYVYHCTIHQNIGRISKNQLFLGKGFKRTSSRRIAVGETVREGSA